MSSSLKVRYEAKVDFDADLFKYGIKKGVHVNEAEREVYAPVAMWLEAVDLVLQRLSEKSCPFHLIKGISGSGQQHGSVYWSQKGEEVLGALETEKSLVEQLKDTFAHPWSPNWQDASTQAECDAFDRELGGEEKLAEITGSKAHHVSLFSIVVVFGFHMDKFVHWCAESPWLTMLVAFYGTPNHAFSQKVSRGLPSHFSHNPRLILSSVSLPG